MTADMGWLDEVKKAPARPVWAQKLPAPIDDLGKSGEALASLFGQDTYLQQVGSFLVAYTSGARCGCGTCSVELQRVIDTTPGLSFSDKLNGPMSRMILCPECGNKRCPRATHHDNSCTGSNEPGQAGSNLAQDGGTK